MKTNSVIGEYSIDDITHFKRLVFAFAKQLQAGDVVLLTGDLGSGKTTFTQFLGEALGVKDRITSPTYTLVGEYVTEHNSNILGIVHMDLYRMGESEKSIPLNNKYIQEVIRDAFSSKAIIVIEWAEMIEQLPEHGYWSIVIKPGNTSQGRSVTVSRVQ